MKIWNILRCFLYLASSFHYGVLMTKKSEYWTEYAVYEGVFLVDLMSRLWLNSCKKKKIVLTHFSLEVVALLPLEPLLVKALTAELFKSVTIIKFIRIYLGILGLVPFIKKGFFKQNMRIVAKMSISLITFFYLSVVIGMAWIIIVRVF